MDKMQVPLVSICCITYNHENYIRDAIESFLMQKTDFPFEVIIHDDASTDMTAHIVREYEEKYPDIIKPIYQTENQYSKGINIPLLVFKKSKGKYIALCEGDDYWVDPLKLQKQITEMEKHPQCHISFHPAILKWVDGIREDQTLSLHSNKSEIFTIEEVILGEGGFMPTNSIVINKLALPRITSFFEIARDAPIGDYYLQVLAAENGGALYISDLMSVYRKGVLNSWTERFQNSRRHDNSMIDSLVTAHNKIDAFTNYKYSKQFIKIKKSFISPQLKSTRIDINLRKNLYESYNEYIYFEDKILWNIIYKHSRIVKIVKGIKDIAF